MSLALEFQTMVGMFQEPFGIAATLYPKANATYSPTAGQTTQVPGTTSIPVWGVWASQKKDLAALLGQLSTVAEVISRQTEFVVSPNPTNGGAEIEPKAGDSIVIDGTKYSIEAPVRKTMVGSTVIHYRLNLRQA